MTPENLIELQRQRELVRQHLAWLDQQIVSAQSSAPTPSSATEAGLGPVLALPPRLHATVAAPAEAESILAQYRGPQKSIKSDVRKGCLLYAAGGFLLFGLGVFALYFFLSRTP